MGKIFLWVGFKYRNGEYIKNVRKDYDNVNSILGNVFPDGLSSLGCAKILVNCLKKE